MQCTDVHTKNNVSWSRLNLFTIPVMLISLLLFPTPPETACSMEEEPMPLIQKTVEDILVILRSKQDSEWGKTRQKISAIIQTRFDFQEQSRLVLTGSWEERSPEEKDRFISLFSALQEHVYLNRLKDYSGEEVRFTKQMTKEDKALVFSAIVKDPEEIPIIYRMRKHEEKWLVYDVIIDGVSLVKNYQKQFASILEKETFSGLIRDMEEKIAKITAEEE